MNIYDYSFKNQSSLALENATFWQRIAEKRATQAASSGDRSVKIS
jgi:hypothetical protein